VPEEDLTRQAAGEPSEAIRARVERAYAVALARQGKANVLLGVTEIESLCRPDAGGESLLRQAISRLNLSARAYHRVLKVARSIADLAGAPGISTAHVAEAIQYRRLDRP
jgi:magnesium chelatase family protein